MGHATGNNLKRFWIPALLSLTIAAAVFVGEGPVVAYGPFIGFIVTLVALAGALSCLRAQRQSEMHNGEQIHGLVVSLASICKVGGYLS
jgi:hypothetical protein